MGIVLVQLSFGFLFVLMFSTSFANQLTEDSLLDYQPERMCAIRCPLQNQTEEAAHFDVGCSPECKIEQCARGCELWRKALDASCQSVCNGTQELLLPKELYCIIGCNDALNRYFQRLKEVIGTPPPPALVADSLTSTSLSLEWEWQGGGVRGVGATNISYLVQWRYEQLADTWHYCRNQTWGNHPTVHVDNLQPYTKYRFRIALLLSPHDSEPLVSAPSVVISTLAGGPPSSQPTIVRATPADPSRVSLSWVAGPFPNGPLLSYVLHIQQLPSGYTAVKDIPASGNKDFYMFQNLQPGKNYSVSIAMRNAAGLGPAAETIVTTPAYSRVKEVQQLILILGEHHTVMSQAADIIEEPTLMYKTSHLIRGVAVHVRKQLLFVSDSSGMVWVTSSHEYRQPSPLLSPLSANMAPHQLSVDWLNDWLYVVVQVDHNGGPVWQVVRCGLDGQGTTVAVAGLLTKPHHIEVDPYNGYLFWVIRGSGLYRLDLAEISNGIKHETTPNLILQDPSLGAFTVDHTNFRVLVPQHQQNTVLAVSLDGHEVTDMRNNTLKPQFKNVVSLAMHNGLFYWTNGKLVLTEEYHTGQNSYFHNVINPAISNPSFITVSVNTPSSQPIPVPVNPPTGLQAVLGTDMARTSWQIPHLLGGQGKGAWQNWSYMLSVRKADEVIVGEEVTVDCRDINATSHLVQGLEPATAYVMRTAAYTADGVGPWSAEFRGRTLAEGAEPRVLWGAAEGLLMSDVTGDGVRTLLHRESLKDEWGSHRIIDIAWYTDQLYLVSNTSNVYTYNLTSHKHARLKDMESVGSIAVDWVGKRLYWSKPKQQLIIRGNMNGSQHEPLPILTVAKELNIDAIQGFIYWSTGHAVECARLNGKQRKTYYPAELFSGKQVMGLTLDVDHQGVYWIVRSYEGSTLFHAPTADCLKIGEEVQPLKVSSLQHPNMQGPLCYLDHRLLWLRDDHNAVIGDMQGQYTAALSGLSLSQLSVVAVMDPKLHPAPEGIDLLGDANVIPEAVATSSFHVEGQYNSFYITWAPVRNVNYGQVFYELKISHAYKRDIIVETTDSHWKSGDLDDLPPFSPLTISIRALTYWGASPQVTILLHSPPSIPSPPTNPRVFVSYSRNPLKDDQEISAVFRWDSPIIKNGIIIKYIVSQCYAEDAEDKVCHNHEVDSLKKELVVPDIPRDTNIYFQVQACTEVGCGEHTPVAEGNSGVEMPIPRLLVSTADTVEITDFDKQENRTLTRSSSVVDLTYSSLDNRAYWIDDNNHIATSRLDSSGKTKILGLNGTGSCLAVDWVGRFLYWAEHEDGLPGTLVKRLDLNRMRSSPTTIFARPNPILKIEVSPLDSMLYWVELEPNHLGKLMKSPSDGSNIQDFFSRSPSSSRKSRTPCTCPDSPNVGATITLDQSSHLQSDREREGESERESEREPQLRLIWVDSAHNHILDADLSGCHCSLLVNTTVVGNAGLPPTSITADHKLVYWSNATEGRVYSLAKGRRSLASPHHLVNADLTNGVTAFKANGVRSIAAVGQHLQPYPVARCLTPKEPGAAEMVNSTSDSITLALPAPNRDRDCGNVSLATVQFTVFYGVTTSADDTPTCLEDIKMCSFLKTFDRIVEVHGLQPYTNYSFFVAFENHYSELQGMPLVLGPSAVIQTTPGAPLLPINLRVTVLDPLAVRVSWETPPQQPHTHAVRYAVLWRMEGAVQGVRRNGEQPVLREQDGGDRLFAVDLHKLNADQEYSISVRAYSESTDMFSETSSISVKTYPLPNNITLVEAQPYSLNISWDPRIPSTPYLQYEMQYYNSTTDGWTTVAVSHTSTEGINYFYMGRLSPKTKYKFRLNMLYSPTAEPFYWHPDDRFTFRTLGDRPTPPGTPTLQHLRGEVYQVAWEAARENGGAIELYALEGRHSHSAGDQEVALEGRHSHSEETTRDKREANHTPPGEEWVLYHNGTETYWIIKELDTRLKHQFRVRAKNRYGWSDYSQPSAWCDLTGGGAATLNANATPDYTMFLHWFLPPVIVMAVALIIMLLMCVSRHRQLKKKTSLQAITSSNSQGTDVELATLRQLPRGIVHNSNELYIGNCVPSDRELAMLPHMSRDQITLTKFLGSGAFGEVYEGLASKLPNIDEGCVQARVAVKTLRKGASYQEKGEFLKEAQLMGNFQHKHILQLLGICLDNDPNFIIMELMEGGDLLSYLRDHRPRVNLENGLTMADLLSISVDVARGCRYLEEMHFVHRDLACRNCLVSSKDPKERIVKIGDFGLARDIYKNDYYRKEGEGLLPVRWMAPESLVDGVFTSQSDVWAFGVLIWEIISLGQQPYPARSNIEVLHYVRNGGRLKRPVNSTDDMYKLMLKCWSFHPESRPTFKYCLEVLENLKRNVQPTQLVSPHNSQNSTPTRTVKPEAGTDTDRRPRDTQVAGTVTGVPRYLELLYDGEDTGYEIPRHQEPPPSYPKEEEVSSLEQLLPNQQQSTQSNSSHRYSNIIKHTSVPGTVTVDSNENIQSAGGTVEEQR